MERVYAGMENWREVLRLWHAERELAGKKIPPDEDNGNLLRLMRIRTGDTRKEMAREMNIRRRKYRRYEAGEIPLSTGMQMLLCFFFEIPYEELSRELLPSPDSRPR